MTIFIRAHTTKREMVDSILLSDALYFLSFEQPFTIKFCFNLVLI